MNYRATALLVAVAVLPFKAVATELARARPSSSATASLIAFALPLLSGVRRSRAGSRAGSTGDILLFVLSGTRLGNSLGLRIIIFGEYRRSHCRNVTKAKSRHRETEVNLLTIKHTPFLMTVNVQPA